MRAWLLLSGLVLLSSPVRSGAQAPAPPETTLEGEVLNAVTGAPIGNARVRLETASKEARYTAADERGQFHFGDLSPGGYTLAAESPGYLRPGFARAVVPPPAKAVVKLIPSAVITGKVTDPYGVPVSGCMIEILRKQAVGPGARPLPFGRRLPGGQLEIGSRLQAYTDDRGEFRAAPLEAGTYYVVTGPTAWDVWDKTYRNTYYPRATSMASAKPLELAAGQQARADIQILRQTGVRVSGRIVYPSGQQASSEPSLYTHIVLVPENSSQLNPGRPYANAKDDFEIAEVTPGKYILRASVQDLTSDHDDLLGATRRLDVGDSDVVGVDVVLQPFRALAGTVLFPPGCKVVPLRIRVSGQPPFGYRSFETASDASGKFLLNAPMTGRYALEVSAGEGSAPPVSSIRLGDHDVLKDGLEMPYTGSDTLRVSVDCPGKESAR